METDDSTHDTEDSRQRRSRWGTRGAHVNGWQFAMTADSPVNDTIPEFVLDGLTADQSKLYLIRVRLEALQRMSTDVDLYDGDGGVGGRPPSPEPTYDGKGVRTNTRSNRLREKIKAEQERLLEEAVGVQQRIEGGTGPVTVKYSTPKTKVNEVRVTIPLDKFPEYNFKGVLIGPRGQNMKKLEQDTGCKIAIRGVGMRKRKDGVITAGDDMPLHVLVQCSDPDKLAKGVQRVEELLVPVSDEEHKEQLKQLAVINGTLRTQVPCRTCGETGHRVSECPTRGTGWKADVLCTRCGGAHITIDCPKGLTTSATGAIMRITPLSMRDNTLNDEYETFMADIMGEPSASASSNGTATAHASVAAVSATPLPPAPAVSTVADTQPKPMLRIEPLSFKKPVAPVGAPAIPSMMGLGAPPLSLQGGPAPLSFPFGSSPASFPPPTRLIPPSSSNGVNPYMTAPNPVSAAPWQNPGAAPSNPYLNPASMPVSAPSNPYAPMFPSPPGFPPLPVMPQFPPRTQPPPAMPGFGTNMAFGAYSGPWQQ